MIALKTALAGAGIFLSYAFSRKWILNAHELGFVWWRKKIGVYVRLASTCKIKSEVY
jgi:hypothetical protein